MVRVSRLTLIPRIVGMVCIAEALAASALAANPADDLPYSAKVVGEDVYVRSGPGTDYYPTAKLQAGDVVEVYRRDPGGWCAIRPPRNSFSYVAIHKLKPLGDSVALAKENKVEVRVGSSLGEMRDVIQVRLDRDEPVEVLEEPDHNRQDALVKIAPPPGEFRWISSRFLERQNRPATAAHAEAARAPSRWTQGAPAGGSYEPQSPRSLASGVSAGVGPRSQSARELDALNHDLSARVVQDLSQWQFDDLKRRGEHALDNATNDQDRDDAQRLLDKIGRFESIKFRRDALSRSASQLASTAAAPSAPVVAIAPRYDGAGRLTPVVSSKVGSPPFALVDPSGAVVQYVTPAPGVNLQPFVNHQVGVSGPRTFVPEYQRQQISAQRVTLLDDGARRY
jgi:SH3-like domain-containing protein